MVRSAVPVLKGSGLVLTAEMLAPRDAMQLPLWNRAARKEVQSSYPRLDLRNGRVNGRKICMTWKDRLHEMQIQGAQIARLPERDLTGTECKELCRRARQVLQRQPSVVPVSVPVVIVGDLRSQFDDLNAIFAMSGPVPENNYIFLGNYVRSGRQACRTITMLLLLLVRYPSHVTLLRGSYESRQMTQCYGFYDECMQCYTHHGADVWQWFTDCFDYLPLSAVIDNQIFCVHSGMSPSISNIDQIRELPRGTDYPNDGPINDLLWTEPCCCKGWSIVDGRSGGFAFGPDCTQQFLHENKLALIARAHQVVSGYDWQHDGGLVTIFSAPSSLSKGVGAAMEIDENLTHTFQRLD